VPVITATDVPEALAVIENVAKEKTAPLTVVAADGNPPPINFAALFRDAATLFLLGDHQKTNAALALATVEVLQKQIPVSAENIRVGLAAVNWPGRLQLVQKPGGQKILLDGAHNVAGAETLRAALEKDFAGCRPVFIFGALADKNWPDICRILAPLAAKVFTVPVASGRTAKAGELADYFRSANPAVNATAGDNLAEALNASKDEPFVVITGSLYLVGEALERLGLSPAGDGERGLNEWVAPQILR
jgi:dihydrofolate synthase/folylpolyglutamate synthase